VRFHFLDRRTDLIPRGLIDGAKSDSRSFDPEQVDRLDYFIYQIKERGIYSDLNASTRKRPSTWTWRPGSSAR
jgi:hypothetical protein